MDPERSPLAGATHKSTPQNLGDSLATAYGRKAPVGNIIRISVREGVAWVDLALAPLSRLENLIRSTIGKVIDKQGEKDNYKIVLNERREGLAELHFIDENGNLLGRAERAALLRFVGTSEKGRYRVSELRDASKNPIELPAKPAKSRQLPAEPPAVGGGFEEMVFQELNATAQPSAAQPSAFQPSPPLPSPPLPPPAPASPQAAPPQPAEEITPARRAAEQALRATGADAAKQAIEQTMKSQAKAKETVEKIRPDAAIEAEMESLLKKTHREIVAGRLKDEKQRGNVNAEITWASKMLDTVKAHRQKPGNESKALLCELLSDAVNPGKPLPKELRNSILGFCEEVADKSRGKAAAFAEQILEEFGWRQHEEKIEMMYRSATLQQILNRMEPDKPIDVQNKGLQQLTEYVHRQAGAMRRVSDQSRRNQIAGECTAAMAEAAKTRAYQALRAQERKQLNITFQRTAERLNRGVTQNRQEPPKKR
ncbi:MAG: hypothetical protein GXY83_42015 [Rhodopirellula sp.]|nr:hypothetical protein [Rhodopirellula sp.]